MDTLPNELAECICQHLSAVDLLLLSHVSTWLRDIAQSLAVARLRKEFPNLIPFLRLEVWTSNRDAMLVYAQLSAEVDKGKRTGTLRFEGFEVECDWGRPLFVPGTPQSRFFWTIQVSPADPSFSSSPTQPYAVKARIAWTFEHSRFRASPPTGFQFEQLAGTADLSKGTLKLSAQSVEGLLAPDSYDFRLLHGNTVLVDDRVGDSVRPNTARHFMAGIVAPTPPATAAGGLPGPYSDEPRLLMRELVMKGRAVPLSFTTNN
ncbi:hypothetical protein QOT17_016347 [Balamuthia mandrillaris]